MKNRYEYEVRAQCPVNANDIDVYLFVIESESIIEVKRIVAFFQANANNKSVFQEVLTNVCAVNLGAHVTSTGWHSGVKVICQAP
jgi:hypothetical protein